MEKYGSRTVASAIPFSSLINSVEKAFNPTIYESYYFGEKMIKGIPVLRSFKALPQRNVFGEVVEMNPKGIPLLLGLDRFASLEAPKDRVDFMFYEKNSFMPGIGTSHKINGESIDMRQHRILSEVVGKEVKRELESNFNVWNAYDDEKNVLYKNKMVSDFDVQLAAVHADKVAEVKADMAEGKTREEILKARNLPLE
jgi:hypothetical protein